MRHFEIRRGHAWAIGLVAAGLILGVQCWQFHDLRHDDAFITFRYGQNLASGQGLVFNPGERLMGSTSPAHALLSAIGYTIVGRDALPSLMSILGCVAWSAQAAAVFLLLRGVMPFAASLFVALCLALGAAWSQRFVALETNLVQACVLWAVWAALTSRWLGAAGLAALAGLFRPDAYLLAIPLGSLCVWRLRGRSWKPLFLALGLSLPWYAFAALYFGSVVPHTASAKIGTAAFARYGQAILSFSSLNVLYPWIVRNDTSILGRSLVAVIWLLAAIGAYLLARQKRELCILPALAALYLCAYLVLRAGIDSIMWHLYPVLLLVAILVLSAVAFTLTWLARSRATSCLAIGLGCIILSGYGLRTWEFARAHHRAYWYGARNGVYQRVSQYLESHAEPNEWVLASEPGTVGYYSNQPIIDLGGLVSQDPDRQIAQVEPRWYVMRRRVPPDSMVCPYQVSCRRAFSARSEDVYSREPRQRARFVAQLYQRDEGQ